MLHPSIPTFATYRCDVYVHHKDPAIHLNIPNMMIIITTKVLHNTFVRIHSSFYVEEKRNNLANPYGFDSAIIPFLFSFLFIIFFLLAWDGWLPAIHFFFN